MKKCEVITNLALFFSKLIVIIAFSFFPAICQNTIKLNEKSIFYTLFNNFSLESKSRLNVNNTITETYIGSVKLDTTNYKIEIRRTKSKKINSYVIWCNGKKINHQLSNNGLDIRLPVKITKSSIHFSLFPFVDKAYEPIKNISTADSIHFFVAKQQNLFLSHYKTDVDSFTVGLADGNLNGIYTDDVDGIYVLPYSFKKIQPELYGTSNTTFNTSFFLKTRKKTYFLKLLKKSPFYEFSIKDSLTNSSNTIYLLDSLPNIKLATLNNDSVLLYKQLTKKPILIDFWATWCNPCVTKHIKMQQNYAQLSKKYTIISINYSNSASEISNYVLNNKLEWLFFRTEEKTKYLFNQNGFPFDVLFDKNTLFINYINRIEKLLD